MPTLSLPDLLPSPPHPDSLTLLTSTLGTPCTWLLNACIASALRLESGTGSGVVLVSFLNDERIVREGLRRGAGIDTAQYEKLGKLKVIDGLSELFESGYSSLSSMGTATTTNPPPSPPPPPPPPPPPQTQMQRPSSQGGIPPHNSRGPPIRGGPPAGSSRQIPASQAQPIQNPPPSLSPTTTNNNTINSTKLRFDISIPGGGAGRGASAQNDIAKLSTLSQTISAALVSLTNENQSPKPLLVIESLDLLLASTLISAHDLWSFLLDLRELSHSLILALSADIPLLTPAITLATNLFHNQAPPPLGAGQSSRLETECSAFLGTAVHEADWVAGLRLLDTGVAKDVSGVMRITRGGSGGVVEDGERDREKEVLYYVGEGGGGVEIFDRGQVRG